MPLIAEESESQFAFILWVEGPAAGDGKSVGLPTEGGGGEIRASSRGLLRLP